MKCVVFVNCNHLIYFGFGDSFIFKCKNPFISYVLQVVHTQAKGMAEHDVTYKNVSKNLIFVATVAPKALNDRMTYSKSHLFGMHWTLL